MAHGRNNDDRRRAKDDFAAEPLDEKIGDMLRKSYQDVVEEGIPDDFLNLLKQADKNSSGKAS